jgi:hypothetical protein
MTLVLVGTPILPVPDHPRIRHLGFVSDAEKYDALQAAEFLIMPSYFESLSMVALEAWGMGKPVLANGRCDVLRGQAARSNAGLYYENYAEFVEAVRVLESSPGVAATLGRNGRRFFQGHYTWPIVEQKYLDMFARLAAEPASSRAGRAMEPPLGWWARRQRSLRPAREVLAGLPSGPVRSTAAGSDRPTSAGTRADDRPRESTPVRGERPAPPPDRRDRHDHGARRDRHGRTERPESRERPRRPGAPEGSAAAPANAPGRAADRGRTRRGRPHRRQAGKHGA